MFFKNKFIYIFYIYIGIWSRDIREKSGIKVQVQVLKGIKSLEGKQMIKQVKGVTAQHNKKIFYMKAELRPDRYVYI